MKDSILVVDFGTSNVHVNAISCEDGSILCGPSKKYTMYHPEENMAELKPEKVWAASCECVKGVMEKLPEEVSLRAVSFSYFGDSIMPVDENNKPLTDLMLCFDARGAKEAEQVRATMGHRHIELTGEPATIDSSHTKINWLRKNRPEIYSKAKKYWSIQQYILFKLGLDVLVDRTCAARYSLYDSENDIWSKELMDLCGIDESFLPEVVESDYIVGNIACYGDTRFAAALPVIIGAHDCECGILGTGSFGSHDDIISEITGTYDHLGVIFDYYNNPMAEDESMRACGAAGPYKGAYTCSASLDTAGTTLEWFMREIIGSTEQAEYKKLWDANDFDGSGKLFCVPNFVDFKGKLIGLTIADRKEDIFAAIIEGITFEVKDILNSYIKLKDGIRIVHVGGGLSRADKWMQLRANVFGIPVATMKNIECSAVGAAILAAVSIGIYKDFEKAADAMAKTDKTYYPQAEIQEKYLAKYENYVAIK